MDPYTAHKILNEAPSQDDRWPRALDADYAQVDGRSLFSLLDFACRFSSLVNYYGLDNKVAGDWVELFAQDPFVIMASIVATDVEGARRRLAVLEQRTRSERSPARKVKRLVTLFNEALDLPRQINRWLRGIGIALSPGPAQAWRTTIESDIRGSLRGPLQKLRGYDLGAWQALGSPLELDYSEFAAAWQLEGVQPNASIYVGASGPERIDRALPHLTAVWRPFPDAVADWAVVARPQLTTAFEGGGTHQPHVALLVAFAKLFATAQASLNSLSGRRTDFYFRRVLRERNRPATPDTLYLALACAKGPEPLTVRVPRGTRFSAGKDADGRDIVYESQDGISATRATLARLHTLRVVSGPLTANEPNHIVIHRVVSNVVTPDRASRDGWATFGSLDDEPADLGFAISSPSLELAGGERTIALEIRHAPTTRPSAERLASLGAATGLTPGAVFERLLQQAFALRVSTAGGWHPVGTYAAARPGDQDESGFTLRFTLATNAPAVAGLAGAGVASVGPTVRADLRQERVTIAGPLGEVSVYPLSVLAGILVTRVNVHIEVTGLPGVRIANTDGDVDQKNPFPAFGALPTVGSYLRVRHAELFSKTLSRLVLRVKWFDLPKNRTGFRGYYKGYVIDLNGAARDNLFDNQVFRASVTVEQPGWWTIAAPREGGDHYLFRTIDRAGAMPEADDALAPSTDIEDLAVRPMPGPPADYKPSDGCLRLELTGPAYAFGNSIYQPNMLNAVMLDVPNEAKCDAVCREEYAVLLEARRRLEDLLTDARSARPLLGGLQEISPLDWPVKLAKGVHTAYLDLTRSLLAYLEQRPDAPTRSGWIIRIQNTDVDGRPGSTLPLPGHSYKRIATSTLNLTLGDLLDAAYSCLSGCLTEWQDVFPRGEWRRLRRQLTDAGKARPSARLAALRDLLARLVDAGAEAGAEREGGLLRKCHAVLLAASWVHDCESGCVDEQEATYQKAIRANLTKCIGVIQTLHDAVVKSCKDDCLSSKKRPLPNPPHLPQVEALTVDYSASAPATLYHILPYQGYRQASLSDAEPPALLPQFAHAGNLYLGFSQLTVPQTLHLYARMGQSKRDRPAAPPSVVWEYLVANSWARLQTPPAPADGTRGLQRPGLISLALPDVEAEPAITTVLPGEYQWLRAAVSDHPDDFPQTIGIVPHAMKAVRQVSPTGTDNPGRPLPPGSVAGFLRPVKDIASVIQPAASFGGQPPETDRAFQIRLSERLRHKDRAIVGWDYERLVLERFPVVWKARTIPARRQRAGDQEPVGPGHVRVVIVPGPNCADVADPAAPTASGDTLAEIEQTLRGAAGPFVQVQVLNPVYVRIRVTATIRWREREDPRVCAERLNIALIEYLSPWRSDEGYWSEPKISAFIHSRDDVEALASIGFDYDPGVSLVSDPERCFLTSAARHDISHITTAAVDVVDHY